MLAVVVNAHWPTHYDQKIKIPHIRQGLITVKPHDSEIVTVSQGPIAYLARAFVGHMLQTVNVHGVVRSILHSMPF